MHKLQENSILTTSVKSIHQVITEKIIKPTNNNFKIFKKLYTHLSESIIKDLNSFTSPITLFIPYDYAFTKSLRQDQIDALVSDAKCANKFIMNNIVYEEACPSQLLKYGADYSSNIQRANFIFYSENSSNTMLYFNGQIVNIGKSNVNSATNGMIYRLSTLKLTGIVDFLYDLVVTFKKKFSPSFINSLNSNWLEIIKNESANTTLFMPFEPMQTTTISITQSSSTLTTTNELLNLNTTSASSFFAPPAAANSLSDVVTSSAPPPPSSSPTNAASSSTAGSAQLENRINIYDYMIRPSQTYYQLNDGDVLTSVSNKKYLVNVYPLESTSIPEYLYFIPSRNFQRKTINCQSLESPGLNACSSQLIIFKNERNIIPQLDTMPLIDYIATNKELSYFNKLLDYCGAECKLIYKRLNEPTMLNYRKGYTVILPTNDFFTKSLQNFNKYSKNMTLFKRNIQANIFYGTYCYNIMRSDALIENMLNRKVQSRRVHTRIVKSNTYLSELGILVHKTDIF